MPRQTIQLHNIQAGTIKFDGGVMFGHLPKALWAETVRPDSRNRIRFGLNCLLIQSPHGNILIDTGAGSKLDEQTSDTYGIKNNTLRKSLRRVGVTPSDIKFVIPTHLQFHHIGGATKINRRGEIVPTFPKAQYLIQNSAWQEANNPSERSQHLFNPDDFIPLNTLGRIQFVDGDVEVIPGVTIRLIRGPAKGHQIVLINQSGRKVVFLGDLIPTHYHLTLSHISALDLYPEDSLENKRALLKLIEAEGWLMVFARGEPNHAGFLKRRKGMLSLRPESLH